MTLLQLTDVFFFFFNFCIVTAVCQNGQNDSVPSIWRETLAGREWRATKTAPATATVPGSNKQPCQLFPECLFILWSKLVVKVHATWNHLACKNPGVGQRGFKKYTEAASRFPNTQNTIVTKASNKFPNNNSAVFSVLTYCGFRK